MSSKPKVKILPNGVKVITRMYNDASIDICDFLRDNRKQIESTCHSYKAVLKVVEDGAKYRVKWEQLAPLIKKRDIKLAFLRSSRPASEREVLQAISTLQRQLCAVAESLTELYEDLKKESPPKLVDAERELCELCRNNDADDDDDDDSEVDPTEPPARFIISNGKASDKTPKKAKKK